MNIKPFLTLLLLPVEYAIDVFRAFNWSKASPFCPTNKQLYYDILLLAHTVEKGLSVSNPRTKFGRIKITNLLEYLNKYDPQWGLFPLEKSYGCLQAYLDWHKKNNFDLEDLGYRIELFIERCESLNIVAKGGTKQISNSSLAINSDIERFLLNRFSSRRFLPDIIDEDILNRIVKIGLRTPSQCNRQSGKIHYYSDREIINKLLLLQGGAEEFRLSVPNLFVISSEISGWSGFKARSQAYVDGSLLAMQILNACQTLGLGACPLNLAVSNFTELKICKAGNISNGERLIMMIAFGYPEPQDFVVARSERIESEMLLTIH